ncbi:MAG: hypothetical protein M3P06_17070 [Acidobacteriota bacterium]|nr:hypothetical protein [Acidobacteriota bacterium]
MVQRLIEWLLDSPNPEIDREYADPADQARNLSLDELSEEERAAAESGAAPVSFRLS